MRNTPFIKRPIAYRYYNVTIVLLVLNICMFLVTTLFPKIQIYLALTPYLVIHAKAYWQIITYMFLHGGTMHILLNMLALFLFGTQLERKLGSTEFLIYYLITGIGAGFSTLLINWYSGMALIPVLGASGAIYGLLLAYATLFPDSRIFIFGFFPLRAPVAVLIFAGLELFSHLTNSRSGIAHLTHLSGIVFGYLYFLIRLGINPIRIFFKR